MIAINTIKQSKNPGRSGKRQNKLTLIADGRRNRIIYTDSMSAADLAKKIEMLFPERRRNVETVPVELL